MADKYRFFQGLWNFASFDEYLTKWLRPHLLGDLETIFHGTMEYWKRCEAERQGRGRGDFALATLLFAWMDHLGAVLGQADSPRAPLPNIARCLRLVNSGKLATGEPVDYLVAHFARNALIHSSWPSTFVRLDAQRAFGLNVGADPDTSTHHRLYWRRYVQPSLGLVADEMWVLKLRINVHVLLQQLRDVLHRPDLVTPDTEGAFQAVRSDVIHHSEELEYRPKKRGERDQIGNVRLQIEALFKRAPEYPADPYAVL